jgi:tetratricopeptide (TPR) repeat protein
MEMALKAAEQRYARTPEHDRVYSVQGAIHRLARYVVDSINIGTKTCDTRLLASLPALLEPFKPTTPLLAAVWQYAVAACEVICQSRPQRARQRWMDLYSSLESVMAESPGIVTRLRSSCATFVAETEAPLGLSSALRWIEILEQEPLRRVHAMYARRLVAVQQGDTESAERFLKAAEVLTAQAHAHQFVILPLRAELAAGLLSRDLGALRQAMDRLRKLAVEHPGWIPQLHRAEGYFHALRGDFITARAAFARCLELASPKKSQPPPLLDVWIAGVHGTIWCLTELGQAEEAVAFGLRALEQCRALEVDSWSDYIVRELSLAEAAAGSYAIAVERLDGLIRDQKELGVTGLRLGSSYEARAMVAMRSRDPSVAADYAELAAREYGDVRKPALSVVGPRTSGVALAGVVASMQGLKTPSQRAGRSLSLLCEAARSSTGYLFLVRGSTLALSAVQSAPDAPAPLSAFIAGYWAQLLDEQGMTSAWTSMTHVSNAALAPLWTDPTGIDHHILSLVSRGDVRDEHVGLVVLVNGPEFRARRLPEAAFDLASALARHFITVGDVTVGAIATSSASGD